MESVAFFEKKVNLRPNDLNRIGEYTVNDLLEQKVRGLLENKCSEHGFVLPDSVRLLSHSMGYFEPARFTGDAVYYVKAEVEGEVLRKNKMGLYLKYGDGIRIQVPRDLNLTEEKREEFERVDIGDTVKVILKKSLFQINDPYILTNGIFVEKVGDLAVREEEEEKEAEEEVEAEAEEAEAEAEAEEPEEEEVAEAEEAEGE